MARRIRKLLLAGGAVLGLIALIAPHHRADIQILTHRMGDLSPQRVQAVIDLGVVAISVLVTWSRELQ